MIKDNYLYSSIYDKIEDFRPGSGAYIYGYSTEGRSYFVKKLISKFSSETKFIEIKDLGEDKIIDINSQREYNLRSSESMGEFLKQFDSTLIYLDSSGLNNRICASILKNVYSNLSILNIPDIKVIYAEPATYKVLQFSVEGIFNDLSERIKGIEPLPGFATILPYNSDEETYFVALLGFEGGRFQYVLEKSQPTKGTVYPVIGVPGFRLEYPFVAYWGNRRPLDNRDIWSNVIYASANSIVDSYTLLKKILKSSPSGRIRVAPIGTKPHAIGAVLFAIKNPLKVEIIYDNPIRVKKRTDGVGKIVECSVFKLLNDK